MTPSEQKALISSIQNYETELKLKFLVAVDTANLELLAEATDAATLLLKEIHGLPTKKGRPKETEQEKVMKEEVLRHAIHAKAHQEGVSFTEAYNQWFSNENKPTKPISSGEVSSTIFKWFCENDGEWRVDEEGKKIPIPKIVKQKTALANKLANKYQIKK